MDYHGFLEIIEQHAVGGREAAERASHATLQTLGERIDREEARQLAAELPPELAPWIATMTPAERFGADEFVRRVARRAGVDVMAARDHVLAVFDALERAVSDAEWDDVVAELPRDFAPLLPRGLDVGIVDADAFLQRVADCAGIDVLGARRATDAVLRTLAERIAGGEVDDLIVRLPMELHEPLERGKAATGGRALPLRVDRFVQRLAEREGVGPAEAAEHARAVFAVLHETLGDEDFFDVVVQLPKDYVDALIPRLEHRDA